MECLDLLLPEGPLWQPPAPGVGESGELAPEAADDWSSALAAVSSTPGRPTIEPHDYLAWRVLS